MEKDSHYYVIYFMCLAAGLDTDEAYEIAYSSQYVDDSKDGMEKILLDKDKNKYKFDPLRTAHNGFESIGVDVQQKIYYPFHFLPGLYGDSFEQKMVTHAGAEGLLFKKVADEALNSSDRFRIGICLHVLADTFSHANFSGLWTWSNDVKRVNYIPASKNWFRNLFGKLKWHYRRGLYAAAPPIGHSNAYTFPDIPYLNWKYFNYEDEFIPVSNNVKFVKGFLDLYGLVIGKYAEKKKKSPRLGSTLKRNNDELRQNLWEGVNFSGSLKKRYENWKTIILNFVDAFNKELNEKIASTKNQKKRDELQAQQLTLPDNHLQYDENEWEKSVLKKVRKFFLFASPRRKLKVPIEDFSSSPFYCFHEAARDHRAFVLELVKDPSLVGVRAAEGESMISHEIIKKTREKEILIEI